MSSRPAFVAAAACFVFGLGTRVTSVIVWFANLCYIHRNPVMLFGVDTMMTVLLLYLMIGPSGAALSLDRVISRWWRHRRGPDSRADRPDRRARRRESRPTSRSGMMQIHLCIIYFISGISKLQGGKLVERDCRLERSRQLRVRAHAHAEYNNGSPIPLPNDSCSTCASMAPVFRRWRSKSPIRS